MIGYLVQLSVFGVKVTTGESLQTKHYTKQGETRDQLQSWTKLVGKIDALMSV